MVLSWQPDVSAILEPLLCKAWQLRMRRQGQGHLNSLQTPPMATILLVLAFAEHRLCESPWTVMCGHMETVHERG